MDFWWFQEDLTVFVCPSVRSFPTQDLRIDSLVFFDFLHEVSHKVRNVTKTNFSKKSIETQKVTKMTQKWGFRFFYKNQIHSYVFLLPWYESTIVIPTFCKICLSGKKLFLELWPKNIYTKGILSHTQCYPKLWLSFISKIKFAFCMCLGIHKNYKFVVW